MEVELVLLEVLKVLLHLQEALERLRGGWGGDEGEQGLSAMRVTKSWECRRMGQQQAEQHETRCRAWLLVWAITLPYCCCAR